MLIENLDVLFPSKYLTRIRSLELCGYFYLKNWPDHHPRTALLGYCGLETVLVAIRDCFPSLRELYLSIDSYDIGAYLDFRKQEGDSIDTVIDVMEKSLGIVDEIAFQKHDSLKVEVALSARILSELRKRGSGEIAPQYPRLSVTQGKDDSEVCNCVLFDWSLYSLGRENHFSPFPTRGIMLISRWRHYRVSGSFHEASIIILEQIRTV
jgi:hypothetical protein